MRLMCVSQWARKFKIVQAKKKTREMKLINFTKKNLPKFHFFAISKMTKNKFFDLGKSFKKLPKM